jgi:hypothetical protein
MVRSSVALFGGLSLGFRLGAFATPFDIGEPIAFEFQAFAVSRSWL